MQAILLDARGRIVSVFACLRVEPERFIFEAEAEQLSTLNDRLEMFHFAEDFTLSKAPFGQVSLCGGQARSLLEGLVDSVPAEPWAIATTQLDTHPVIIFSRPDRGIPWFTLLCAAEVRDEFAQRLRAAGAVPGDENAVDAVRIEALNPTWPYEYNDQRTPLDVSGMDGLTDGKGCYPGQEVIERTLALGRPARILMGVESAHVLTRGTRLYSEDKEAGEVTSVATLEDGTWLGLASIKNRYADREAWQSEHGLVTRRLKK